MKVVEVELGERRYPVVIGRGVLGELDGMLPPGARRAAVITQSTIRGELPLAGVEMHRIEVPDGEAAKSLTVVEHVCRELAHLGFTRGDVVIGFGGGVVTDLAGFVAAVYHRGVPVVHVATTLLAQVDAAIGGKTGVNLPEGKNLVGAFWQPRGVICDVDLLSTLPARELRSGLGEVAKYQFLGADLLRDDDLVDQVAECVAIKAEVVASDEREGDRRAVLNYGHTLAHALEIAGSFDLRHGEAVAIGLVFAARLARRLGRIGDERVKEHRTVVARYDLSCSLPPEADVDVLIELMQRDKKALDGLTFVLDGPAGVEVVSVSEDEVRAELTRMAADR